MLPIAAIVVNYTSKGRPPLFATIHTMPLCSPKMEMRWQGPFAVGAIF